MKTALTWTWVLVSGAVIVGSWFLTGDPLVVVIASIVWVLVAGWVISHVQES